MTMFRVDTINDSASMEIETEDDGFFIEVMDRKDLCRLRISFAAAHALLQFLFEHTQSSRSKPSFHGETSELPELTLLPLTDAEFFHLQHIFAYFQLVQSGDLLNGIKVGMMIRQAPLGHHKELEDVLVDKMNRLALARFTPGEHE